MDNSTYIFVLVILSLFLVIMYKNNVIERNKNIIETQHTQIDILERDNELLENSLETINRARERENILLDGLRKELKELKDKRDIALGKVDDVYKDKNNNDNLLPDSLVRLLSEACEDIRGSPCANP